MIVLAFIAGIVFAELMGWGVRNWGRQAIDPTEPCLACGSNAGKIRCVTVKRQGKDVVAIEKECGACGAKSYRAPLKAAEQGVRTVASVDVELPAVPSKTELPTITFSGVRRGISA